MSKLISLKQFIKKYNGKSVDVPWGYKGECVSLIQRYLNECYGVEMKARGNAKDWQNSILRAGLGVTTNYPVRGDIVIWGAEAGNGMGHISIYLDKTHDFDQNKGGDRITGIKTRRGGKVMAYMHITPLTRPKDVEDKPQVKPNEDTNWVSEPNYQIVLNRDIEERNECIADSSKATGVKLIKKGTVLRVSAWRYAQGFVWRKLDNGKVISTGPQGDGQAWAKLEPYKKPIAKPVGIKVGDLVKIKDNSFYQGASKGKQVSKYAYSKAWKVLEVKGNIARLDSINSWLLISDLVKV